MNTRYVILLFYDIPNKTKEENSKYLKFNKYIKSIGFVMIQESVYAKKVKNKARYKTIKRDVTIISPPRSNIRSVLITERVFDEFELLSGEQTFREKIISNKIRILEL